MNLEWSESYEIDIPELDVQHKEFLKLIHDLYKAQDRTAEMTLLEKIFKCAISTFISEEELMQMYDYPELSEQKKSHQELLMDLSSFVNPIEGYCYNKKNFIYFICKWFLDHIIYEDRKLGRYVNNMVTEVPDICCSI